MKADRLLLERKQEADRARLHSQTMIRRGEEDRIADQRKAAAREAALIEARIADQREAAARQEALKRELAARDEALQEMRSLREQLVRDNPVEINGH